VSLDDMWARSVNTRCLSMDEECLEEMSIDEMCVHEIDD
jgi:hypothetical protein